MANNWKKFEQNNKTIALNILFVPHDTKTIRLAYKSKYNRKRDNQVVLLMTTVGKKWQDLALKNILQLVDITEIFTVWAVYIHFAQIMRLKNTNDCVITMITVM